MKIPLRVLFVALTEDIRLLFSTWLGHLMETHVTVELAHSLHDGLKQLAAAFESGLPHHVVVVHHDSHDGTPEGWFLHSVRAACSEHHRLGLFVATHKSIFLARPDDWPVIHLYDEAGEGISWDDVMERLRSVE